MTATTETTTAECINNTVGTAQETTETVKATESMSATAEIMPPLRRCNAGIDEGPDDVATRISMKAAAMTDADYSSADTMELPPKNAEVMQAMAEEEKAWAAQPAWYRAWAKTDEFKQMVDEENEQEDEEEEEEGEVVESGDDEDDSTDAWADSEYDSQDESEDSHFTFVRTISKTYRECEKMVTYLRRCRRLYPEEVEEKKVEEWDPTDLN